MRTGIETLSDVELAAQLQRLARSERESTVSLIAHLAEFDSRRLYLGAGFRSLFVYCTEVLHLSEHEAYNRIEAARVARRFPRILEMIAKGALNLTTVRLLAPHMTEQNQERLLGEASGRNKREVEELVARYAPQPDVPCSVRKVPMTGRGDGRAPAAPASAASPMSPVTTATTPASTTQSATGKPAIENAGSAAVAPAAAVTPAVKERERVRPLAPGRYEIRFTATAETCAKLRLAQDLLRHAVPDGEIGTIVGRALSTLLEDLARSKFAATTEPRTKPSNVPGVGHSTSRHIPAAVKRNVWLRDGGHCAFVGRGGRRCNEAGFLEFHHMQPFGLGGPATVDNIRLRCRAHNAYEAELVYDPERAGRPGPRSGTSSPTLPGVESEAAVRLGGEAWPGASRTCPTLKRRPSALQ